MITNKFTIKYCEEAPVEHEILMAKILREESSAYKIYARFKLAEGFVPVRKIVCLD